MLNKLMFFLDVMFYYSQLQYNLLLKKVSPSNQPSIILGAIIGFPLVLLLRVFHIELYCLPPSPLIFILVCFGCIFLMLKLYEWNDRKKKVLREKPLFFGKKKLSIFLAIVIELISLASLFLGGPIGKYLLEKCGWTI